MHYSTESSLRLLMASLVMATSMSVSASAAWPWTKYEGSPRIDPIATLGNRLPESFRRQYNRPTYLGGKIAAKIAPSSQEAMSFHRSESLGLYDQTGIKGWFNGKKCPPQRVEQHYFYPKPWEVLAVGPRRNTMALQESEESNPSNEQADGDQSAANKPTANKPAANKPTAEKSFQELLNEDTPRSMDLGDGPELMELPAPQPETDGVPSTR